MEVVKFYREYVYQTGKQVSLNTKTIGLWVCDEDQIKKSRKASKCVTHKRKCQFPDLEKELYRDYKNEDKRGAIQQFHRTIRRVADERVTNQACWPILLRQITNVEHT